MEADLFRNYGVRVILDDPSCFSKIKETLQRIGIVSNKVSVTGDPDKKTLIQSCHILHKKGEYVIIHFKELFAFDGKPADITTQDIARRNTITGLLAEWDLCKIVILDIPRMLEPRVPISDIKIVTHKDRVNWNIESKYNIGKKRY